jgi:hypothetical protein
MDTYYSVADPTAQQVEGLEVEDDQNSTLLCDLVLNHYLGHVCYSNQAVGCSTQPKISYQ